MNLKEISDSLLGAFILMGLPQSMDNFKMGLQASSEKITGKMVMEKLIGREAETFTEADTAFKVHKRFGKKNYYNNYNIHNTKRSRTKISKQRNARMHLL
jgi:hypothetical protein